MGEAIALNVKEHDPNCVIEKNLSVETISYNIGGKTFIVEPIFKKTSTETIGTILTKLIKADDEIT